MKISNQQAQISFVECIIQCFKFLLTKAGEFLEGLVGIGREVEGSGVSSKQGTNLRSLRHINSAQLYESLQLGGVDLLFSSLHPHSIQRQQQTATDLLKLQHIYRITSSAHALSQSSYKYQQMATWLALYKWFVQTSYLFIYQMFGISDKYEQLWRAIIRPPRAEYTLENLGPKIFKRKSMKIERTDVQIVNKEGKKLQCSHFQPLIKPCRELPCVIYLHGNSSCRLEGARIVPYLISRDITVFTFDFAGCGLSEGQYISLGYYERGDVDAVFKYLRGLGTVSSIGIWGRSMGAVTALMYADTNHEIGCVVLDSPFSNLQKLSKQLAQRYGGGLSMFSGIALSFVKSTIKDKHNFDIEDLDPIGKHVKKAFIPAFFIHGKEDDFIVPKHSEDLYAAYSGGEIADKRIRIVQGDHNSDRGQQIYEQVATFFYYGLYVSELVKEDKAYVEQQKQKLNVLKQKEKLEKPKGQKQKEKKVEAELIEYSFGVQNEEEEMLRQAIALSLAESVPKENGQNKKKDKGDQ